MIAAIMTPPREVSKIVYGPSEAIKRIPPALAALPLRPQTPEAAAALATPDPTPTPSPPQHEGCTTSSPSRTPLPVRSREKPTGIYAPRRDTADDLSTGTEELSPRPRPRPGCVIDPVSGRERKRIMTDDFPKSRMRKFEERRRRAARLQIQREKECRAETPAIGLQYSASSEDSEDSECEIRRTRPGFVFDRVINKERKRNMMDDFKEVKHEERRRQRKRRRQD